MEIRVAEGGSPPENPPDDPGMAGLAGAGGFANLPAEIPGLIAFGWFGFDFQQHRLVEV